MNERSIENSNYSELELQLLNEILFKKDETDKLFSYVRDKRGVGSFEEERKTRIIGA